MSGYKDEIKNLVPEEAYERITVLYKARDRFGYAKYILEDDNGFRGCLEDGVSFDDMKWHWEWIDGWHESVALDGEKVSKRAKRIGI